MRTFATTALIALAGALAGCASPGSVTLLAPEPGAAVGGVAVFDPTTDAERGALTSAGTQTSLGGAVRPRAATGAYQDLLAVIPPAGRQFNLYFQEGSTTLLPESEPTLKDMLAEVAKRPGAEVQITGHTDTLGSTESNDALSLQRAGQIRDALVAQGLDPSLTRVAGRGERDTLIKTEDGVREDRNRRVEVTVR